MKIIKYLVVGVTTTTITSILLLLAILYNLWGEPILMVTLFAFIFIQSLLLIFFIPRYWSGDWEDLMDTSLLDIEKIEITMKDGYKLVTNIIKKKDVPDTPKPAVILLHGANESKEQLSWLSGPFALAGYIAICPDARGYGENEEILEVKPKKDKGMMDEWIENSEKSIKSDLKDILDYIERLPNVDKQKIAVVGHSMGAVAGFMNTLADSRIKMCICMNSIYTFIDIIKDADEAAETFTTGWFFKRMLSSIMEPEEIEHLEKKFSPRYQLKEMEDKNIMKKFRFIHTIDDELIPYENSFQLLQEDFNLPSSQYLLLAKGQHKLRGQETIVTSQNLTWLWEAFN